MIFHLVGGLVAIFLHVPIFVGLLIIPTDELIFFRGVQSTNQYLHDFPSLKNIPDDLTGENLTLRALRQRGLQPVRWPKPLADDEKSMASFGEPDGPMGDCIHF